MALVLCGLCLLLFLGVGTPLQSLNLVAGLWVTELFVFLGVPLYALQWLGRRPLQETTVLPFQARSLAWGFLFGAANFFAFVIPLQFLATSLAPKWLVDLFDSTALFEGKGPGAMTMLVLGVGLAAPVCEEFFFRGIVQPGFSERFKTSGAIFLTSFVFSAFHLDPVGFLARLQLGVLFGILFLRTGTLWSAIGAHAANNLVSTALFLGQRQSLAETAVPEWRSVLFVSLGGLCAMGALFILKQGASHAAKGPNASSS